MAQACQNSYLCVNWDKLFYMSDELDMSDYEIYYHYASCFAVDAAGNCTYHAVHGAC
jgi:hypothetical protein